MYNKNKHIHFVGIGGIGMSGIAEVLLNLGYQVSGSDLRESAITRRLAGMGGTISLGHDSSAVGSADVVVTSSAVPADNPEVVAAREAGIPVIARAEMLAELMRLNKFGIAIAGSHGKTTTTSLVGWLLSQAGLDPTVIIGGKVNSYGGSNAKLGEGEFLVAEADESDGSFLRLAPVLEVVTNIDLEHLDYYLNIDEIKAAFLKFINKIPFYGTVFLCLDDANIADILPLIEKRVTTYGMTSQADFKARKVQGDGLSSTFEVFQQDKLLGSIHLPLAGRHNVYNALAAVCIGMELEIPFPVIASALETFTGVQRRQQIKGEKNNILVIDDYGHHPTEIRATLVSLKEAWPERRLLVIFQPHRYSRTARLLEEFHTAFHHADFLVLTDIYGAGEQPFAGVSGESLAEEIRQHGQKQVLYIDQLAGLAEQIVEIARPGDVILTLGAGNIWRSGEEILALL
jgi:UDP-N-acetylmuramate--alanine ligase